MRCLLLKELFMLRHIKKGKYNVPQKIWHCVTTSMFEEDYRKKKKLLEKAGIDYRVRMDANDPDLVTFREYVGNPDRYRIWYGFYVTRKEYDDACRALKISSDSLFGGAHFMML